MSSTNPDELWWCVILLLGSVSFTLCDLIFICASRLQLILVQIAGASFLPCPGLGRGLCFFMCFGMLRQISHTLFCAILFFPTLKGVGYNLLLTSPIVVPIWMEIAFLFCRNMILRRCRKWTHLSGIVSWWSICSVLSVVGLDNLCLYSKGIWDRRWVLGIDDNKSTFILLFMDVVLKTLIRVGEDLLKITQWLITRLCVVSFTSKLSFLTIYGRRHNINNRKLEVRPRDKRNRTNISC